MPQILDCFYIVGLFGGSHLLAIIRWTWIVSQDFDRLGMLWLFPFIITLEYLIRLRKYKKSVSDLTVSCISTFTPSWVILLLYIWRTIKKNIFSCTFPFSPFLLLPKLMHNEKRVTVYCVLQATLHVTSFNPQSFEVVGYYYTHFTDEDTESLEIEHLAQGHSAVK